MYNYHEPSHGKPFLETGAYYRADNPYRFCSCVDCQKAHRLANRTPDSPYTQGMIVETGDGTGVVYQTNQRHTFVDLFTHRFMVRKYPTGDVAPVVD